MLRSVHLPYADPKECPACINFMIDSMEILLDAIANGGIIGGCNDLCGYLPKRAEFLVCDALCDYAGIEEFVRALNKTDPDPIFVCEEINVCPKSANSSARITQVSVSPADGPEGTIFDFEMTINVTSALGTGVADLTIVPPGKSLPFSFDLLLVAVPDGVYPINFKIQATPSESEDWPVGQYNGTLSICEGFCDSIHKYQYILDHKWLLFNITKKMTW